MNPSEYSLPGHDELTEDEVYAALDFLIAVEPDPPAESGEAYEAAIAPHKRQIDRAMAALRRYGRRLLRLAPGRGALPLGHLQHDLARQGIILGCHPAKLGRMGAQSGQQWHTGARTDGA